jgi:hypothetical protein
MKFAMENHGYGERAHQGACHLVKPDADRSLAPVEEGQKNN